MPYDYKNRRANAFLNRTKMSLKITTTYKDYLINLILKLDSYKPNQLESYKQYLYTCTAIELVKIKSELQELV